MYVINLSYRVLPITRFLTQEIINMENSDNKEANTTNTAQDNDFKVTTEQTPRSEHNDAQEVKFESKPSSVATEEYELANENPTTELMDLRKDSYTRLPNMPVSEKNTCIENFLIGLSYALAVVLFPFSLFTIFVVVRHFERIVIFRNGKVYKNNPSGPGLIHYLPCVDTVKYTDLRITSYAVPLQEGLTKDSLTVSVDAVVFYKINNPLSAVINVVDYHTSTQFLAATTLRHALGTRKLSELLVNRPAVSHQVFEHMKRIAREWGIKVVRVDIKDIMLPVQMQKAMAAEAESTRLANANLIVTKAEIEATKNLQIATKTLMDNPLCMQLRYLQSLHMIAGNQTHTIVCPISVNFLKNFFKQ